MRAPLRVLTVAFAVLLSIPLCGFAPDAAQAPLADVIVTAAPVYAPQAALQGKERFPKGAQLQLVHAGKAELLVANFAATADAQISFDAEKVLFAGKQKAGDPWQIWELTLKDRSVRKVITSATDAVRPFYLPYGQLVYARRYPQGLQLERAEMDGSNVVRLTYLPASVLPADVLQDGRILFEAGYPLGTGTTPEMYLVYADGSGVESYRCDHGLARWGGKQLASGDVVFTHGATLARFTSPLAHEERVAAPHAEYAGALAETADGAWLLSARTAGHYALKIWQPDSSDVLHILLATNEDLVEPVLVAQRNRPKRHPSGLHPWSYANMMALDARESRDGALKGSPKSVRLETLDAAGHAVITGTAPVEADGSFFVKVPGDQAIRFALLDSKGAVLRQEHGWFWIRGGEQRICVGCHVGPERASENKLPVVLQHTTSAFDLSGTAPKETQQQSSGGK